jgi:DNA-binding CsgD family transcriptional regulator
MLQPRRQIDRPEDLTPHEARICIYIAQGLSSEEIGRCVGGTSSAIEVYVHRLMRAIGLRNRSHLVAWFLRYPPAEGNLTRDPFIQSKPLTLRH